MNFCKKPVFILMMLSGSLFSQDIHELVKPSLDDLREEAEKTRLAEEEKRRKLEEEAEAKRLEEEARQAAIEAAKADPLIDVETLDLAEILGKEAYKISSGDTLGKVASDRYGSSQYFPLIELWNGVKATSVRVGQEIKTPSVATIVKIKGKNVLARYPEETKELLQIRIDYLALQDELYASVDGGMTDELKSKLDGLITRSKAVHAGYFKKRPGVENYASGLLQQCKNLIDRLSSLKQGKHQSNKAYISGVHTHLAYAMRNAIIWGQEDFN